MIYAEKHFSIIERVWKEDSQLDYLAQIAAMGHQHLLIRKEVRQDRTYTEVAALNVSGREEELARIIGGEVTPANLQAAREMLAKAEETENRG